MTHDKRKPHLHIPADFIQLLPNGFTVGFDYLLLALILLVVWPLVVPLALLQQPCYHAPGGAPGTDHVLVGHRQQVPLLVSQLLLALRHECNVGDHVFVALGLFGHLCLSHQV